MEVDLPDVPRLAFASTLQKMDRSQDDLAFSQQLFKAFAVVLFRERFNDMPRRQGGGSPDEHSGAKG